MTTTTESDHERDHERTATARAHLAEAPPGAVTPEEIEAFCRASNDEHFALDACCCLVCGQGLSRALSARGGGPSRVRGVWWHYRCDSAAGCGAATDRIEAPPGASSNVAVELGR